jgi:hypothetical protein
MDKDLYVVIRIEGNQEVIQLGGGDARDVLGDPPTATPLEATAERVAGFLNDDWGFGEELGEEIKVYKLVPLSKEERLALEELMNQEIK